LQVQLTFAALLVVIFKLLLVFVIQLISIVLIKVVVISSFLLIVVKVISFILLFVFKDSRPKFFDFPELVEFVLISVARPFIAQQLCFIFIAPIIAIIVIARTILPLQLFSCSPFKINSGDFVKT
jgi:hypothetical protein